MVTSAKTAAVMVALAIGIGACGAGGGSQARTAAAPSSTTATAAAAADAAAAGTPDTGATAPLVSPATAAPTSQAAAPNTAAAKATTAARKAALAPQAVTAPAATAAPAPIAPPVVVSTLAPRRQPTSAEIAQVIAQVKAAVGFYTPTAADIAASGNQVCTAFDQGNTFAQVTAAVLNSIGAGPLSAFIPASAPAGAVRALVALYCPGYTSRLH